MASIAGLTLAILSAGSGGASSIFLFLGFFIGLIGASFHCLVLAFKKGHFKHKLYASLFLVLIISWLAFLRFSDPACLFTEQQAKEKVLKHLAKVNLDPKYLGNSKFTRTDCSYSYTYESSNRKFEFIFSNWGKVHTWNYERGDFFKPTE